MVLNAWRTLILQEHEYLSLRDNQLVVHDEDNEICIPVEPIREILITSTMGSISLPLLVKLAEQNTKVVFCNNRKNPVCELSGINLHTESGGRLMDQAGWTDRRKDAVWRQIVNMKIKRQADLLRKLGLPGEDRLLDLLPQVASGDSTNREAVAAKIYFNILFDESFTRFNDDPANAALNYGYAILCSAFNRIVTLHGFNTALGIHHCSRDNSFNLSCDLMEPFRPFVDDIVYKNLGRELDWNYKLELIAILQTECMYNGMRTTLDSALDAFVVDFIKAMAEPRYVMTEVSFAKE